VSISLSKLAEYTINTPGSPNLFKRGATFGGSQSSGLSPLPFKIDLNATHGSAALKVNTNERYMRLNLDEQNKDIKPLKLQKNVLSHSREPNNYSVVNPEAKRLEFVQEQNKLLNE
jgi:hypothetical protein